MGRALLADTPIVLFDEATAALDAENEHALQEAMSALARDRTVLAIAHRLHTLREADQVIAFGDGRVVEEGVHDDLVARDGRYAHFLRERRRAQGWHLAKSATVR